MARCFICGKPEEEILLFDGVSEVGIKKICYGCSEKEGIALIKKPTKEQLEIAEKRRSVREVMEQMSSPQKKIMVKDQMIAHKNLAKLKFPGMKEEHGDLVENYDWILKQARRHAKITTDSVARLAGIDKAQYESLEAGKLFSGFQAVAAAVERVLEVKILKAPRKDIIMLPTETKKIEEKKSVEQSILESVRQKMKKHFFLVRKAKEEGVDYYEGDVETQHDKIDVDEIVQQKNKERKNKYEQLANEIESDKFDFSRRENLDKITLQDLADLKKLKKQKEELNFEEDGQ
jgi:transcriptional regulator with XRE-family HTH domain